MKSVLSVIFMVFISVLSPCMAQDDGKTETIMLLKNQLNNIQNEEKENLKIQIENINSLLNNGIIDTEEANRLKLQAAEETAKKIEERQTYLNKTIQFLSGVDQTPKAVNDDEIFTNIDAYFQKNQPPGTEFQEQKIPPVVQDKEYAEQIENQDQEIKSTTTVDIVFAAGLTNTIRDNYAFEDFENEVYYDFEDSHFVELGFALKSPLTNKNGVRLKYGLSFQSNVLAPENNQYFIENNGITSLETANKYIGRSRFIINNIVVPIHMELGPTRLRQHGNSQYYSTRSQFKIGIGGYIGFNVLARQRFQTFHNFGRTIYARDRYYEGYDVNSEIYGLSAYIGVGGLSIYGKYDLNTIFDNAAEDERFISIGLRLDL